MQIEEKKNENFDVKVFLRQRESDFYRLAYFLLKDEEMVEETLVSFYSQCFEYYEKEIKKVGKPEDEFLAELFLFGYALGLCEKAVRRAAETHLSQGRDLRVYENQSINVLEKINALGDRAPSEALLGVIRQRVLKVEFDFRVPLVLKDILGLSDEVASRLMKVRWGVYRHRLHRGRVEFLEGLQGTPSILSPRQIDSAGKGGFYEHE